MPTRRTTLAAISSASIPFVAGCLGNLPPGGSEFEDDWPTIPDSPESYPIIQPGDRSFDSFYEMEFETRELGTEDDYYRPHAIKVGNVGGVSGIDVGIIDTLAEEVMFKGRHTPPDGTGVKFRLLTPAQYIVKVRVPESDYQHTVRVMCSTFDCNASSTQIGVFDDDDIASSNTSLGAICGRGTFTC